MSDWEGRPRATQQAEIRRLSQELRDLRGVGTECRRCLGDGVPQHFSLSQPDGPATCPTCHGTGKITPRITP